MGGVAVSVIIDRPVAEVFGFVTDLRHDIHWYEGVQSVRVLSDVDSGLGTVFEQQTRLFGRSFTATMEVTAYDAPHSMTLVALRSMTPFTAHYTFVPAGAASTLFTLTAEVTGKGVYRLLGPLFVPLVRAATAKRLRILKRVLEAESPA